MKPTKITMFLMIALISALLFGSDPLYADEAPAIFAWFPNNTVDQITPGNGFFYQACVHPDPDPQNPKPYVLCSGNYSGSPHIWQANLNTKFMLDLGPQNAASIHGVYSWNGEKIAFASDMGTADPASFGVQDLTVGGVPEDANVILNIYVMDADGNNKKQLTFGSSQDQRPTFSPDGQSIVFVRPVRYANGALNYYTSWLWKVPTAGGTATKIPMFRAAYRPWFSADGNTLYFFIFKSYYRQQIASMPVGGGIITPLIADDKGMSHGPFVDPTGGHLLMHSNRAYDGNGFKIYEINLVSGQLELKQPPGFEYDTAGHATVSQTGVLTFDAYAKEQ